MDKIEQLKEEYEELYKRYNEEAQRVSSFVSAEEHVMSCRIRSEILGTKSWEIHKLENEADE